MSQEDTQDFADSRGTGSYEELRKIPYNDEPDYTRPLLKIPANKAERLLSRLGFLYGGHKVLMASSQVFTVLRISPDREQHILTMTNVTGAVAQVNISLKDLGVEWKNWYDLVGKRGWRAREGELFVILQPYDVVWLIPFAELEKLIEL